MARHSRKPTVLILDDDDDFRTALAANLEDEGYTVEHFRQPADVSLPSLGRPALLIVDYQMDGEDGLSFADRFHAAHPDVPVLMVTAYWSRSLDVEVEARDFITLRRKPIDYDELAPLLPADR